MSKRGLVIAVAVVLVGWLSGCDTTATGTPSPESDLPPSSESSNSGSPPSDSARLAPPVENPKNLRGIDPCRLLTQQQLTELTFTEPGEKETTAWGDEACNWHNSKLSIGFSPDTKTGNGLDQAYQSKDNFDNFEESQVDGYPAVRINASIKTQSCVVEVGVADDQSLSVHFGAITRDPAYQDPCGFAESVVAMVLENLPAA